MATPSTPHGPPLRALLAEAGWTGATLAREINAIGREAGMELRYDRTAVAHWLSGMRPRPPIPGFAAEALSRALNRVVTAGETGLAPAGEDDPPASVPWPEEITTTWSVAGAADTGRHCLPYNLATLPVPERADAAASGRADTSRAGHGEVAAIATMERLCCEADAVFGAGTMRLVLADYLSETVSRWLRASATPNTHGALLVGAARLSYLAGFMLFDDELHGAAQRYYRAALRLASEGGDMLCRAMALRAMSVQAHVLGHHRQALQLAEAAVRSDAAAGPQQQAFLRGQLAVAYVACADHRNAVTCLLDTERHLDQVASPLPAYSLGSYHRAAFAHQEALVRASLGEREGAIDALQTSVRLRPEGERRSRVVVLARLADLQLTMGRLEEAMATWNLFLADYPAVRSRRADTALATLRARLRPHAQNPTAQALLHRAAAIRR